MMTNTDHAFNFEMLNSKEKCEKGHPLQFTKVNPYSVRCDRCSTSVSSTEVEEHGIMRCPECKFDVCRKCVNPDEKYATL
jgi:DNA-directed RNA polymerase subunit RPC12/RpoP